MGLDNLEIPANPSATVEVLDGSSDEAMEASLQIIARSFSWTPEQVAEQIRGLESVGVDLLLLQFSPQLEEMERFSETVMPLLEGAAVN